MTYFIIKSGKKYRYSEFELLIERLAHNVVFKTPIEDLTSDAYQDTIFDLATKEAKEHQHTFCDWVFLENLPSDIKDQADDEVYDHIDALNLGTCERGSPFWHELMCLKASRRMIAEAIITISLTRGERGGGFLMDGLWVDDPYLSECGRFPVDPKEWYGLVIEKKTDAQ